MLKNRNVGTPVATSSITALAQSTRKRNRKLAQKRFARWLHCKLSSEEDNELEEVKAAHATRVAEIQAFTETLVDPCIFPISAAPQTFHKVPTLLLLAATECTDVEQVYARNKNSRQFMKTYGRRMQAKPRVSVSHNALQNLEDFNLCTRQHLSAEEKRTHCCRNASGTILEEIYADHSGSRTSFLFGNKTPAKPLVRKEITDPGSQFHGWNNKCLMNAVLSCVSGDVYSYIEDRFRKKCSNNVGSGL